jgi:hypothetical protein
MQFRFQGLTNTLLQEWKEALVVAVIDLFQQAFKAIKIAN